MTINELKDAFFSLQTNKRPGHDGISFNVIKNCFGPLSTPLLNIFNLSLEKGIFPDELKIARVTPICKTSDENDFGNYRPISVLLVFLKCSKELCIRDFIITYRKTTCYIRNNLAFKRVIQQNML